MIKTIELYTPYEKQAEIHKSLLDPNIFGVVVVCGRQVGKTLLGINQAIYWGLKNKNQTILFVLPTDSQAQKVYKQLYTPLINTGQIKSHKGQSGSAEVLFSNGSSILFRSALQEDSLRGYSVDYLIIDEAAFISENTLNSVLLPTLAVKGKKVLLTSTPKGKNILFKYFNKSFEDPSWRSFRFTSYENPYSNKEFIDSQKQYLSDEIFAQEYLAEFVDKASIFKNLDDIFILPDYYTPKGKVYCGVDLGMVNDYTVAIIMDENYNVVDYIRFTDVSNKVLQENLINFFDKYNPTNIVIENVGLGIPIVSDLLDSKWGSKIIPFITNSRSKSEIITNLIGVFNNKKIKIKNDPLFKLELESFIFINTGTGNIKYQAASGAHDDMVMSLAFTLESFNRGAQKEFDIEFFSL
jgi:hypothetical protein